MCTVHHRCHLCVVSSNVPILPGWNNNVLVSVLPHPYRFVGESDFSVGHTHHLYGCVLVPEVPTVTPMSEHWLLPCSQRRYSYSYSYSCGSSMNETCSHKDTNVGRKFRKDLAVGGQQAAIGEIKWRYLIIELQRHEDWKSIYKCEWAGQKEHDKRERTQRYCWLYPHYKLKRCELNWWRNRVLRVQRAAKVQGDVQSIAALICISVPPFHQETARCVQHCCPGTSPSMCSCPA